MALPVTISGISTAVPCVGPFKSTNSPIISAQFGEFGSAPLGDNGSNQQTCQSFTTVDAFTLTSASLNFGLFNAPTDGVFLEVRSTSQTGTLLGTSDTVAASSMPSTSTWSQVVFTFSTPISLAAATQYFLVAKRTGAQDASQRYNWNGTSSSQYSGGNRSTFNGSSWSNQAGDHQFSLIGDGIGYYFFGRDSSSAGLLDAYKATDPTSSWSQVDTETHTDALFATAGYQVGDIIHIATIVESGGGVSLNYITFDMSIDAFIIRETVASGMDTTTNAGTIIYGCSIVLRSDGDVIILYNGPRTASMGSSYSRIVYARREGTTWTTNVAVDALGQQNWTIPEVCLGSSDRAHFFWHPTGNATARHRSLTSGNVLQAEATISPATETTRSAISFDDNGTQRIVTAAKNGSLVIDTDRFASADTPTISSGTTFGANLGAIPLTPLFNNGTDIWCIYHNTSDNDLYAAKSTDAGSTFGTPINIFTSTVTGLHSHDGNIYQRDLSKVIPYIVNDSGTLKYNEYAVATAIADAWNVLDKSSNITLSASDKTATASSATAAGVRSTQQNSSTGGEKYYIELVATNVVGGGILILGIGPASNSLTDFTSTSYISSTGAFFVNDSGQFLGSALVDGDVACIAWDTTANLLWFRVNGGGWNSGSGNPAAGTGGYDSSATQDGDYAVWARSDASAQAATIRTEAAEFTQTPPTGFKSWMGETLTQPKAPTPYKQAPRFIRRMR